MSREFTHVELSEQRALLILTLLNARDALRVLHADQYVAEINEVLESMKVRALPEDGFAERLAAGRALLASVDELPEES